MEDTIITFGSESLILEMTPELIETTERVSDLHEMPENVSVLPVPEIAPEILKPKGWCIVS